MTNKPQRIAYWSDFTGACHKVCVVAETTDGRHVISTMIYGLMIVNKAELTFAPDPPAEQKGG